MKTKTATKKLSLAKSTLRSLGEADLKQVAGGRDTEQVKASRYCGVG